MIPSDTNNARFPKSEASRYMTNIRIIQYDDVVRQIFAVDLIDAYPISIAAQPLNWGEDGFHRVNVQFTYSYYKTIYRGDYDVIAAASELLGAGLGQPVINGFNQSYSNLLYDIFR